VTNWRDQILKEFTPQVSRLTLVADPDGLLLEEGVLAGIRERGFELIPFDDHMAFRYAYASKFRSRWDKGDHTDLVVVLRSQASDLASLPYDLLQAGRRLSFNLGDIFPSLSYPVLSAMSRGDLDALFDAQQRHTPGVLGDNATKEFALRHVFEIASELIKQPADLLRVLLRRHYRAQRIPSILDERFIQLLRATSHFDNWPLETLVSSREAFFAFLQERWPIFLSHLATKGESTVREVGSPFHLSIEGPVDLPFDHQDVRVYIDSLFLEGLLHPVSHPQSASLAQTWTSIGVCVDQTADRNRRLLKLLDSVKTSIPATNAKYTDWLLFARIWAELILVANEAQEAGIVSPDSALDNLKVRVDSAFLGWLTQRYAGLINLPPVPPVMLHHLPRFLARQMETDPEGRFALVIIDGLALDQWFLIRNTLQSQHVPFSFLEDAVFAWLPTITAVSRQAALAGKAPAFFPASIQTTAKEPSLWAQFWADHGLSPRAIGYLKALGDDDLSGLTELVSQPNIRVAGLIVDKIDRIMHGMELGSAGMHNQIRQWCAQQYLPRLLTILLDHGFRVWLTSDHGNIEAGGCGNPKEGASADIRGERVRLYPDQSLRATVKQVFPEAIEWPPLGLPDDCLPLFAPHRKAFIQPGTRCVSHGSASIEEVIVPLIQIGRSSE